VRVTYPDDGPFAFNGTENRQALIGLQDELQVYQIMPVYAEISRLGFKHITKFLKLLSNFIVSI
jgi:hypothetical protein